jgi:hypothetical protein
VLETLSQLHRRVIKPNAIVNKNQEFRTTLKLLNIICQSGPVSPTLQEAAKVSHSHVYDECINDNDDDDVEEDILITDEKAFCDHIKREWENFDEKEYVNSAAYTSFLYKEYKLAFWNHLHTIIFGADAYWAFK